MITTIRAAALQGYADLARSVGLDPLRMLHAVGIPSAALADPERRIPTAAFRALLENSARATEDFGLRLAEQRTPSIWGPLNLVLREQPTVRDIIAATIHYSALQDESVLLQLEETADVAVFSISASVPPGGSIRQSIEIALSQFLRLLRRYLGPNWRPLSICLVYAPPKSTDTHYRVLGRNLEFNCDFNGLVFNRADLDQPNPAADPEMTRQVERYAQGLMVAAEASLPDQVRREIQALLRNGRCTIEITAERIGLDVRTMQRQLADAGSGFLEILQRTRMDLADQYIRQSDRPLAEVAELLGFSALSAFSRWHKAHYRCSPSARRAGAHRGGPVGA